MFRQLMMLFLSASNYAQAFSFYSRKIFRAGEARIRTFLSANYIERKIPLVSSPRSFPSDNNEISTKQQPPTFANRALLISSFTDGVAPAAAPAQQFLKTSLISTLANDALEQVEDVVESSAVQSPCCGPDMEAVAVMEELQDALLDLNQSERAAESTAELVSNKGDLLEDILQHVSASYGIVSDADDADARSVRSRASSASDADDDHSASDTAATAAPPVTVRLLYIPTAMYALRADSTSTPGKQRQRARYDGKQRRKQVEELLYDMLNEHTTGTATTLDTASDPASSTNNDSSAAASVNVNILAVTLDLDDGSIKQPVGSDDPDDFPKDGEEALTDWSPHMIYVEGGNTFWLHHCMTKGGWADKIVAACSGPSGAVYCGKSAGAIIAGKHVETATWKQMDDPSVVPGMEEYEDWAGVSGLSLCGDLSIFPHMASKWEDLVEEKQKDIDDSAVLLTDWDVCCISGDTKEATFIGIESSTNPEVTGTTSSVTDGGSANTDLVRA
uniref:Uncharacterized protein n=1 Tax=Leptocylindrus danicus TaxID=163516 RepID=A0A7S2NTP8_9STRA